MIIKKDKQYKLMEYILMNKNKNLKQLFIQK